jgi:hypothetical protein
MRRILVALTAAFVTFTGPHGGPIYVVPEQVIATYHSPVDAGAPTAISTSNGTLYVKEAPEAVVKAVTDAKALSK